MREKITDCGCPEQFGHRDRCPTLTATEWPDGAPKIAPVQGYIQGIPWALQLEAYNAYAKKWGGQPALIDLDRRGCRGGFGTEELDEFIPGWRDRVSIEAELRRQLEMLRGVKDRTFAFGDQVWPGLGKLNEECGEVVQVIGKLMMTHGHPQHWSGDLREMLLEEIADVEAAIVFFNRHNMTPLERRAMAHRVTKKVNQFEEWHRDQADTPAEEHVRCA